jgi:hypothetical protein
MNVFISISEVSKKFVSLFVHFFGVVINWNSSEFRWLGISIISTRDKFSMIFVTNAYNKWGRK